MQLKTGRALEDEVHAEETATDLVPRMLTVTAAMGASSAIVIAMAAIRSKVVAVELGPQGIGALTLLTSFLTFAALVLGLGMGQSAIREIAAAHARGATTERDDLRRALYVLSFALATAAALAMALSAGPIAALLGDRGLEGETRLCALALFAMVITGAARAELNGLRRIRVLAIISPLAGVIATVAAVAAWLAGADVLAVVLIVPAVAPALVSLAAARSLPERTGQLVPSRLISAARRLIRLGVAFVLNAALAALGALVLRVLIEAQLGGAATGEFQAAFAVTGYYLSFIFAALVTDYLPLLSGLAHDAPRMNRAANTQVLVAVLLAAPAVMALIAAASFIVPLFYSGQFNQTPELLRIMLLGELTRVAAWTLGYILVARTAPLLFVMTELIYNALLIGAVAALIPVLGLVGTAWAYLGCQVGSLAWTLLFVRWTSGFRLAAVNVAHLAGWGFAAAVVYVTSVKGGAVAAIGWLVVVASVVVATRVLLRLAPEVPSALWRFLTRRPRPTPSS
jgi:antigen flippase